VGAAPVATQAQQVKQTEKEKKDTERREAYAKNEQEKEKELEAKMTTIELARHRAMKAVQAIAQATGLAVTGPNNGPQVAALFNQGLQPAVLDANEAQDIKNRLSVISAALSAAKSIGLSASSGATALATAVAPMTDADKDAATMQASFLSTYGIKSDGSGGHFSKEYEINDYPQKARWEVTSKKAIARINEETGAAITARGSFTPAGRTPGAGEKKLYLLIEGPTERVVYAAMQEVIRLLEETTLAEGLNVNSRDKQSFGKYSVV
jgi:ATP-dependent RNA helicase DDX46/PRP5